ncbi:glucose-1-phosphate adenylyltransferase subunit GlgD [Pisciglobus halotolerans]|uniref:Glucose-1-phosphate adenylyltransferase n=1 Tax=Pisciglobus halotolerans TaxID=745365 RepID=A0A1I3C6E3_9LACT|nr:glucose-1-phosphate adenylyltransferase subunit GlgD [Pisciglobus halotolerans]SFH70102.1 glucose-1-phosphate adenylyltransferase [Pisciglobus halotolerans]
MLSNKMCAILNLMENDSKLKPLTNRRPIATLPFASRYRLIDFQLTSLYGAEIGSAAIFIEGSGHSLYDHIRSGSAWGLDSTIGGGVFTHSQLELKGKDNFEKSQASYFEDQRSYVKKSKADYVVIMGSQMLCNIDLQAVLRYHKERGAAVTAIYKNVPTNDSLFEKDVCYYEFADKGSADIQSIKEVDQEATSSHERLPIQMRYEIVCVDKFLEYLDSAEKNDAPHDMGFISEYALEAGDKISGYEYTGYLKDIDSTQSYFEANMEMLDDVNYNALFYRNQQVITKAKNGAPTYYAETANVKNVLVATDCIIEGEVENAVLFRKVEIKKTASVKNAVIMQGAKIAEDTELNYVILDKNVKIEPGVKLIGTPEKPIVVKKNEVIHQSEGALNQ